MPEVQALLSLPKLYEYVGRVAMSMFMNDSQTLSASEVKDDDDIWRDVKRLTEDNALAQRRQQQQQQQQQRRQVLSEDDYVAIKMSSVNALMDLCVLHEKGDGALAFTHKSFRDYFCAHFMLMDADRRMNDDHDDIHESALCLKLVTKDVSMLRWCAWLVNMDTVVVYQSPFAAAAADDDDESKSSSSPSSSSSCFLWDLINESKRRDDIAVAAANCVTILNTAGVSMCGRDFTGIHAGGDYDEHGNAPFADLGSAQLIGAILRRADLRGARLQQAQLDACDLRDANLSGVEFGEMPMFLGHTDAVTAIAVSGDFMFSGSDDKSVRQWRISTGELVRTLEGHSKWVSSVAVSRDFVFSGSYDKSVKQWRISTGELIRTLVGHSNHGISVAVRGDFVFSRDHWYTGKKWRISSGECVEIYWNAHISELVADESNTNRFVAFYDGHNVGVKHEGLIVWLSPPYRLSAKDALVFGIECSPVQKRLLLQLGADDKTVASVNDDGDDDAIDGIDEPPPVLHAASVNDDGDAMLLMIVDHRMHPYRRHRPGVLYYDDASHD